MDKYISNLKAERVGFKPTERTSRSPDFESGPFGHSGIFPLSAANILTFLIRYHRQQQIFL